MLPGDAVFIKRLFVLLFGLALGYHFRQGWADTNKHHSSPHRRPNV
jgi:hypothetical protein